MIEYYQWLSQWSAWFSQPFVTMFYGTSLPILGGLLLGIVGALSPCQVSANMGAITYFSQRSIHQVGKGIEILFYLLGKAVVYTLLGAAVILIGKEVSNQSLPVFIWARKLIGPLFLLIGLYFVGWLRLPGNIGFSVSQRIETWANSFHGNTKAFLMGFAFSLGFCPTMFWVFFGLLAPMMLNVSYGLALPPIFAVGTAMPLIILFVAAYSFQLDQWLVKRMKKWGKVVQIVSGILFILIGINDTLIYWTL
ncbi:sulfite exporter TauE/SafE family protein [Microaerobacter geothermalis]|uniref:sulfite exporter TauE/SafE family protein n=1 Tax=Microaerobacter geothermalis TaxID=674972 RepID=UPI001F36FF2B|nr:sulfite exporter TauE/SafE family protein [Microaerobacter geothermalis]MCF6092517.1 sulfite exporter TauE/SafE family protein [Microaerobacter geothermalis]